ncbi:hypothetical protein Dimus_013192 [Dionaea muscipula]
MPEATTSIDYVMEKASGPHFSGLRLDGLLSSTITTTTTSATSSPRHPSSSSPLPSTTLSDSNASHQPFVIGNFFSIPPKPYSSFAVVCLAGLILILKLDLFDLMCERSVKLHQGLSYPKWLKHWHLTTPGMLIGL